MSMTATSEPNEIHIVRIYDAPLKAVWDAWADPAQAAQWWGPRGFTITTHHKDLRSGGSWTYTMHGPDGAGYPNRTHYLEVEPLSRLVYDHGGNEESPPMFRVTVQFSEVDGKTLMDMRMHLPTAEALAQTRHIIKVASGNSTWDRLAEYLARRLSDCEQFVINRTFEAPLAVVFDMWTRPEHFSRWLAPAGFDMHFIRAGIAPGATTFYSMTGFGMTMYGRARYETIDRPHRLVYTQQFCDEHENITRHPMAPAWPETMRSIVDLHAEGPNRTRVTVTWEVAGPTTAEELAVFTGARNNMTQGWTGSFDKLDDVLAETVQPAD
jgi:uncharacterized protein YndB with AHSA1/START domain